MKNINKNKGFTLIELLAVIVILAVIALIATPIILGIISDSKKQAAVDNAYGIIDATKYDYVDTMYGIGSTQNVTFTYENGEESSSIGGHTLNYEGTKPQNGQVGLTKDGQVAIVLHDGKYCVTKGYNDAEVTIDEKTWEECAKAIADKVTIVYNEEKGVNNPKLAKGMTPIKWDGSNWVETTINDSDWFSYDTTNKKWANAITEDGSMWVWIPRYAYQIESGYHTNTAGIINVKFLQGTTNTTKDSAVIELTPTYSDSDTQSNFIKHPAFTFGDKELTGIWVAKFEASGTTSSLDFKPGVVSLKEITVGNMFAASRNMETNNKYGWDLASGLTADGMFTTNTNNIDTHMMKNSEWGAVAYLSKSSYGKDAAITTNNNSSYYTGGGSGSAYVTNVGQSTTGNIYGIYDMSGGSMEYVMGNYNNTVGDSELTPANINGKYIDRYTSYSNTKYGDSIYETSASNFNETSWYGNYSYMITSPSPWLARGGLYSIGSKAGVFNFNCYWGGADNRYSFRPVLSVASGL